MTQADFKAVSLQQEQWVKKHHQFGGYLSKDLLRFIGMPNANIFLVTNTNNNTFYFRRK